MLRSALLSLVGAGAAWVAWASYTMWQAAARNSASPGAIVLLGVAGAAALFALLAFTAAATRFGRRPR
jgi:hypothetical protein